MITIQHKETDRNGLFEAWLDGVQVGEMTYQRPTLQLPGRWFLRVWNLLEPTTAKSSPFVLTPVPSSLAPTNTKISLLEGNRRETKTREPRDHKRYGLSLFRATIGRTRL